MARINTRLVLPLLVAVACVLSACQMNPTTGRRQAVVLSWSDEVAIGMQETPKMVQEFGGEVAKEDLRAYVAEVGNRLAGTSIQDDPVLGQLPWEFKLLNSDVVNAFALPGGKVFMSRGLAQRMTSEAQLAAVLGHEIGHVAARHTNERIARLTYTQMGLSVAGVLLGGGEAGNLLQQLGAQSAQFWLLSYDRDQEHESDALGVRYMVRAGYDPIGAYQVMEILASLSKGNRQPEMLSTHPDPEKRMQAVAQRIQSDYAFTQGNPQYRSGEQEFRTRFLQRLALLGPPTQEDLDELARVQRGAICTFASCSGECRGH